MSASGPRKRFLKAKPAPRCWSAVGSKVSDAVWTISMVERGVVLNGLPQRRRTIRDSLTGAQIYRKPPGFSGPVSGGWRFQALIRRGSKEWRACRRFDVIRQQTMPEIRDQRGTYLCR